MVYAKLLGFAFRCTLSHRYQHSLVACRPTLHFSTTAYKQGEWKMSCGILICPDLDSMFRGLHEELVPSGSLRTRNPIQWYCTTPRYNTIRFPITTEGRLLEGVA